MKKLLALACTLALAFTAVACSSESSSSSEAESTAPETTSLVTEGSEANGEDGNEPEADTSWEAVEAAGQLVIGLDDTFAPMGFRDEDNNLIGFDIDLAEAVGEILGVEIVFQPIDWDAKEMELSTGKIDCIWNGMSITPEREESMTLSRGYLDNKIIIMTTQDVDITDKAQLADYDVTTQAKSAALEVVQSDAIYDDIKDNIVEYNSYDDCILDMQSGRAQVMVIDAVAGEYKNTQLGGAFKVSEIDFGEDLYAVGFRKGDFELMQKVQDAIDEVIANGEGEAISEKWFGRNLLIAG